ncbi:PAS domain-containing protein [Chloroflexota bacterium]
MERYARELQLAELGLRTILRGSADGKIIVNKDGVVQFANPAAESILDRRSEELLGGLFGFPIATDKTTGVDIVLSDGITLIAEMRVTKIRWDGEISSLVSIRDLAKRKQLV